MGDGSLLLFTAGIKMKIKRRSGHSLCGTDDFDNFGVPAPQKTA
jgi:hypothetical protein